MIHETALIHPNVKLGESVELMEYVILGSNPTVVRAYKRVKPQFGIIVGDNTTINSGTQIVLGTERDTTIGNKTFIGQLCVIGHDSVIGNKVIMTNHVSLNGFVEIGDMSTIYSGVSIRNRVKIGKRTVIGMGSVVTKDIPDNVIAYGNPCKVIRSNPYTWKDVIKQVI